MCDISHLPLGSPINSLAHHSVPFMYFYPSYQRGIHFKRNGTNICHKCGICSLRAALGGLKSDF